jgi:hypothetical protein
MFIFCAIVQVYIVYMGSSRDGERDSIVSSHVEVLSSVLGRYGSVLMVAQVLQQYCFLAIFQG